MGVGAERQENSNGWSAYCGRELRRGTHGRVGGCPRRGAPVRWAPVLKPGEAPGLSVETWVSSLKLKP